MHQQSALYDDAVFLVMWCQAARTQLEELLSEYNVMNLRMPAGKGWVD